MNEYCKSVLPNGLRVITIEMPHRHSAEMACYVGVGGRNEGPDTAGISHFLEHMLFRGTADHPSSLHLEQAFEAIGGAANASTDAETTCYHSRLHPQGVFQGVGLLASMLRRPTLGEIDIERRIILEEALEDFNERGENIDPDNLNARLLWPGHPLSIPTIGTRESISVIGPELLRKHMEAYYTPANTVLVLAGKIHHNKVMEAAKAHFADWQGPPAPAPLPWSGAPPDKGPETVWVKDSDSQVALQLAFHTPGRNSARVVPLRVLRRVLSWGGTSRLMLRLREALGLTYNVEANLSLFEECGSLSIDLAVAPESLTEAVKELLRILTELRREAIGEEERERVVRSYLFDLDFSRDNPEDMVVRYGWGDMVDYLRTLEDDRREISAVAPAELLATAREVFVPGALKVAVVGPYRQKDRKTVERMLENFGRVG
jgi:predicted Zn-dependent peptidase